MSANILRHPAIASDIQGIVLHANAVEGGGITLTVREIGGDVFNLLHVMGRTPLGMDAFQVFANDRHVVDEWTEALVKLRSNFGLDPRQVPPQESSCRLLQYMRAIDDWVATAIDWRADTSEVYLTFSHDTAFSGPRQFENLKPLYRPTSRKNPDVHWEIDLRTQKIFLSRRAAQTFRLGGHAVILPVVQFFELFHPDDLTGLISAIDNIEIQSREIVTRAHLRNASTTFFASNLLPGYGADGNLSLIYGSTRDITSSMTPFEKLNLCEARLGCVVNNAFDLFLIADADNRYIYASANSEEIMGLRPNEITRYSVGDLFRDIPGNAGARKRLFEIIRNREYDQVEIKSKASDGHLYWLQLQVLPIAKDLGGETLLIARDITEEKKRKQELIYARSHDQLTGLYNRHYFWKELSILHNGEKTGFCLVLLDINGLKLYNDVLGYQQGDEVLKETADILSRVFDAQNLIARVGEDEFAVIVHDAAYRETEALCERVGDACADTQPRMLPLSISWGIAAREDSDITVRGLIHLADSRMNSHKLLEGSSLHNRVIVSLKEMLRSRNIETADHTQRMEDMVASLGKRLGLSSSEHDRLQLLAALHDIGKVAIPDSIISKPGRLDGEEWTVMQSHCETGYRIAKAIRGLDGIAGEIYCHHERWDGSGYPQGLAGENIPLLSRILSVVDAYDVMTSNRPYKEPISHQSALNELRRCSSSQFDPDVVNLFQEIFGGLSEEEARLAIGGHSSG